MFSEQDRIYAYAIAILIGTAVQLAIPAWDLRNTPFHFTWSFEWRNPGVRRVLLLMLPVTISLGLINFNALINSLFGSLVSDEAPAAIDKAFRLYQLPQGIFSVAIATVLFPTLARFANNKEFVNLRATLANGMRQILFVLRAGGGRHSSPSRTRSSASSTSAANSGRRDTTLVGTALFWFAFSLPTNGVYLLQTRTFFSLQRPWQATGAGGDRPGRLRDRRRGALQALRRRRDRRRDRHRDQRRGLRPGLRPAPRVRRPRAGTAALDRDPHLDRLARPGRGRLGGLGRPRQRPRPQHASAQIVSLGTRDDPRRRSPTSSRRGCCGSPSSSRSSACCAGAAPRCSGRADTCWARSSSSGSSASPALGASRVRRRLLPEVGGEAGFLATAVVAIALLLWVAELLGTVSAFKPVPYLLSMAVLGLVLWRYVPPAGGAPMGAPRRAQAAEPPSTVGEIGVTGPAAGARPFRPSLLATVVSLLIAGIAIGHFVSGVKLRLGTGMTGFDSTWYHGPFAAGFFQSGNTIDLHFIAPQFLAWFYPANGEVVHAIGMLAFSRDLMSPLLNLGWLVGCLLACWCIGRPFRVAPWSLALGAIALSVPALADQAGEARNDIVGIFFLLAAVAIALNAAAAPGRIRRADGSAVRSGDSRGDGGRAQGLSTGALLLVGLAIGLAAGTKLNFLLPAAVRRARAGGAGAGGARSARVARARAAWHWPGAATGTCGT